MHERLRPDDHIKSGCNRHPQLESCCSKNENSIPRRYPQNDLSVMRTGYEGPNGQDKMVFGVRAFCPRSPSGCMEKCSPVTTGQKTFEERSSPRCRGQSMGECMERRKFKRTRKRVDSSTRAGLSTAFITSEV